MSLAWEYYEQAHASRRNLLIHLVAVPLFDGAFLWLIWSAMTGTPTRVFAAVMLVVFSMLLQKSGHAQEVKSPRPFSGPADFARRWFTEQFLQFPLFVLSGRWAKQFNRTN